MSGKITDFFREYILIFSTILAIIGAILLIIGVTGLFYVDFPRDILNISKNVLDWSIYILIIGFIVFAFGIYYLYTYLKNRRFILKELETNKRSELKKNHLDLKRTVKHMPSRYKDMLHEKEKELNLK